VFCNAGNELMNIIRKNFRLQKIIYTTSVRPTVCPGTQYLVLGITYTELPCSCGIVSPPPKVNKLDSNNHIQNYNIDY
jgi:hypothetical protein